MASAKEVEATRKRIRAAVVRTVKKTAHNREKMPWSEISEGMTSEMAEALCADLPCSSDSKVMKKWELCNKYRGTSIAEWLRHDEVVDNVKFNGKVWWPKDLPMPRIKVKAVFVSLEVKFKKAAQSLSVRVRTSQV